LLTGFWAIFFVARHKKGISALQLQCDTGVGSYETAWTLLHKLRSALGVRLDRRLQGDDRDQPATIPPRSHRIFGNFKTWLRGSFHGASGEYLPRYLGEFVYRFDRRWRGDDLFGFALQRAAARVQGVCTLRTKERLDQWGWRVDRPAPIA
jgi:hypothetical protein